MLYYTVTCTRKRWLLLYLVMIYLHSTLGWVEQARELCSTGEETDKIRMGWRHFVDTFFRNGQLFVDIVKG